MQDVQGIAEMGKKVGCRIEILERDRRDRRSWLRGGGPGAIAGSPPSHLASALRTCSLSGPQLSLAHHARIRDEQLTTSCYKRWASQKTVTFSQSFSSGAESSKSSFFLPEVYNFPF